MNNQINLLEKKSIHQVLCGRINSRKIIVYSSGIVLYEIAKELDILILAFFKTNNLTIPKFEKYSNTDELENNQLTEHNISKGWKETPKSVWLSIEQRKALLDFLDSDTKFIKIKPQSARELTRYEHNKKTLVFNQNDTIYTIGGFEGYQEKITEILKINPLYPGYNLIIEIDVIGINSQIGPVIITSIALNPDEMVQLQLLGVKHRKIGRSKSSVDLANVIKDMTDYYSICVIEPKLINEISDSFDENGNKLYQECLLDGYKRTFRELMRKIKPSKISNRRILFVYKKEMNLDLELFSILSKNNLIEQLKQSHNSFVGNAASSTLSDATNEIWKEDKERKINLKINQGNLSRILKSGNPREILKFRYLRN